jgi:hypothetical protein
MPSLLLQRADNINFWQSYPAYVNRTQIGEIPFTGRLKVDLEPGRYLLAVGARNAQEAQVWCTIKEYNKAFEIQAVKRGGLQKWPKTWQINLVEKGPIQLKSPQEQQTKKRAYRNTLWKQAIFNLLVIVFLAWPAYIFYIKNDYLFLALVIMGLLVLWQINVGVKKFLLRKEPRP